VKVQAVTLGPSQGDNIAITNGLSPGDKVVIDGADKLRDGAKINVRTEAGATDATKAPDAAKSGGKKQKQ
jgi:multidrug efflux system membrane fusion protein